LLPQKVKEKSFYFILAAFCGENARKKLFGYLLDTLEMRLAGRSLAGRWPVAGRSLAGRWPVAGRSLAGRWPVAPILIFPPILVRHSAAGGGGARENSQKLIEL
jgi:hypothetical protein